MHIDEREAGETGRDYAYRVIRYNIIYRELTPGMMLSEKEIAQQLGLSRTPVREALIELAKTQIVEVLPQRGSRVSYIDYSLVEEANFVRKTLEKAVAELACDIRTVEDLRELNENLVLQEFYIKNLDHIKLQELDDAFHKKLFQICNKMQAYNMMTSLSIHFDRVRDMSLGTVKELKIVEDHTKIAEAIKNKDKKEAAAIIEKHLNRFKLDEEAIRKAYPDFFK